ncbi:MAG: hypothetical protein COW00_04295 [Bdellovibrio sp. CG12_big_fil_rev_8_21_14_0_65_39_13]|nr:MAG: hypothetical protein COW78_16830 [Bdellovibrio sp. CG22_combo_CG10-13_8_21_14_all_39_27]PIQ61288.1 MAG: hypothetical protein COW00_04295 [Bdellovibrio sp. CG12_big_fil_rev_8_21_14_0_65_39_13]PIR36719.1 MAG: hypothetical protein COV37_01845 [Bdellovibrio sp. CG11_big_fil_rev_8_21_14_0_20_39_38]PJB53442.1 MAG: hypothetical protein CO099_07095 [Bdellovibrio sp. CG_4_9_14_3_um_filter_39_7]
MLPKVYYSGKWNTLLFIVLFFLWVFGLYKLILTTLLIYLCLRWLFRRKIFSHFDGLTIKQGLILAPLSGFVVGTRSNVTHKQFGEDLREIRFMIPWHTGYGIFLPDTAEVEEIKVEKGPSFFRLLNQKIPDQIDKLFPGLFLTLRNLVGDKIHMQFVKCTTGYWPELRVMPGDRGRSTVNIGYFPFGGTVLLYLPSSYEILVTDKQFVEAGQTPIAARKEN